jgi:DNA helicase-2/ATP-dependent DNA helicase PcrA
VLAGPGTGKSATVVALLDKLLADASPPRVRLLTFTRAATAELAKKCCDTAVSSERPSTIHSFSISVLVRNAGAGQLPEPLRIADDWEYKHVVRPTLALRVGVGAKKLEKLVREMAANWESLRPDEDPQVDPAERNRFLGSWDEHRRAYGYTLLSELPYALRRALLNHPDLDGVDYDLLVVDEYQDLNACDLQVIKLIANRGCFVIGAGDDDQSVYAMRKAAPEGIRRFLIDYPGAADYPLSVTHRCGSRIIDWASSVIERSPERLHRPRLTACPGSPPGEVALLSFAGHVAEARGIARLVKKLVEVESVPESEILILLASDDKGRFSIPIKRELERVGIKCADPDRVKRILEERENRRLIEALRLLVFRQDSLAWASLLKLQSGVGPGFTNYIYDLARSSGFGFGESLLSAYDANFSGYTGAGKQQALALVGSVLEWLNSHAVPEDHEAGWGGWIVSIAGDTVAPEPSEELGELLSKLDAISEDNQGLSRYLGQIAPLGQDLARAEGAGARIMTMASSKGLTVRATIVAALENDVIPHPGADTSEQLRLLYVAMTRSREFLYGTWARYRRGPTAHAGNPRVSQRRSHSSFLDGGPISSQDGAAYVDSRWPD